MDHLKLKCALALNFVIGAILMNSVGVVILQSIDLFHVSPTQAGVLEAYKDLTVAIASFFVASLLPHMGYKRAQVWTLLLLAGCCFLMPLINQFYMTKLLFAASGLGFTVIKHATYAMAGHLTQHEEHHASFISIIEGFFQLGVLCGSWLFALFMGLSQHSPEAWLDTYWLLGGLCLCSLLLIASIDMSAFEPTDDDTPPPNLLAASANMFQLLYNPLIAIFTLCVFVYVLVEQAFSTWLPTFYHHHLLLSSSLSVFLPSILPASIAFGRLFWGMVMRFCHWMPVLLSLMGGCLAVMLLSIALLILGNQGQTIEIAQLPLVALLLPMLGFFLGPVYPTLCSTLLSSMPKEQQPAVTGWIIIFSALGGTTGSRLLASLYQSLGGDHAMSLILIPMVLLTLILLPYHKLRRHHLTAANG